MSKIKKLIWFCLHKHPKTLIGDVHHIQPQAWGGLSVEDNMVLVCPNVHRMTHTLLNIYKKLGAEPAWSVRRQYGKQIRFLAESGWNRTLIHHGINNKPKTVIMETIKTLPEIKIGG